MRKNPHREIHYIHWSYDTQSEDDSECGFGDDIADLQDEAKVRFSSAEEDFILAYKNPLEGEAYAELVGALAYDPNDGMFSVIVKKKWQRSGVARKLVSMYVRERKRDYEDWGSEYIAQAEVINPNMGKLLLELGFELDEERSMSDYCIMIYPQK